MVLRDVLDAHATAFTCQPEELADVLSTLKESPRLVVIGSQTFNAIASCKGSVMLEPLRNAMRSGREKDYITVSEKEALDVPFKLDANMRRADETPAHEALCEAIVNAITNADFSSNRAVVVRWTEAGIELKNPSAFRVGVEGPTRAAYRTPATRTCSRCSR